MGKIIPFNSLSELRIDYVINNFTPKDLEILLFMENYSKDIDIMLDNMLDYLIEYELYEYACVVRDEIERRRLKI
jgi:hypothetical protein